MIDKFEIIQPKLESTEKIIPEKKYNYFFDFIKDISHKKQHILNDDNKKDYSPYMINRFLSMHQSTILYSQEMNIRHYMDSDMHYEYLFNSIRPMNRYFDYKKAQKKNEDILLLSEYYQCSLIKAQEYMKLHNEQEMELIRTKMNKGGENVKTRKTKNKH